MPDTKTAAEIKKLKEGGHLLAKVLKSVVKAVRPGISTKELDVIAEKGIRAAGGTPSFLGYQGFPASLCVSVNDTVVHGIPDNTLLKEGDIVGLDIGMIYGGLFTDMAVTVAVGKISKEVEQLLTVTKQALDIGLAQVKPGGYIGDIGNAIESFVNKFGYGIVRDLAGHGVGHAVHEDPLVPNFSSNNRGLKMYPGLVIAIEPMIIMGGDDRVRIDKNGWDVHSYDHSLTAHFEHTIAVTKTGSIVITK